MFIGSREFVEKDQAGPSLEHEGTRLGLLGVIEIKEDLQSEGDIVNLEQNNNTSEETKGVGY